MLLILGLGFAGRAAARAARAAGWQVAGTMRAPRPEAAPEGVALLPFAEAAPAIAEATHLLVTAGPEQAGEDPVLAAHGAALAAAPRLRWVGYLSTTGVYGDHGGGWVEEDTPPAPGQERSRRRLAAEEGWRRLAERRGLSLDLMRCAGIYGPGRSALDELRAGRARRVDRPGHLFSRIHVEDIARAVLAAAARPAPGSPGAARVLHLADDLPAANADVVAEAARLLGLAPPPLTPFETAWAAMSPMARSFWAENRRISSARTQAMLGLVWRHPSYREGLRAVLRAERQGAA
ncbi:NAD-dependent epimerase/dehydratase family protein [Pseudoroseomonas cervicalis]|uniref:NAD-dependent epimerase/dehydratase family protein n=1 Tax=Teichococcus cervicalis TaxID=204525 RepID=UPI00278B4AD5|nr:NAD-dependent epimerase/dehydratase family protein [Pseudoroseomonas cervicalis]MDQ1080399.1 nucleoside-diphosphate-sugar epimerase [Pseudoroseomonas cervicalis]